MNLCVFEVSLFSIESSRIPRDWGCSLVVTVLVLRKAVHLIPNLTLGRYVDTCDLKT